MKKHDSIDANEVMKFAQHASNWWDPEGPLKTLHDINPVRLAYVASHVSLKNRRILDVGCGGGIFSESLGQAQGLVTGLDVEEGAITVAKQHASSQNLSIEYVCQPLEEFVSSPFDVITCLEMLEHVASPESIITAIARLLKPKGYAFFSTINRTWQAYLSVVIGAEYILKLLPRQTHDYAKFIKPSELADMARKAGLDIIGMTGMSYNPLTRQAKLCPSVKANYLLACRKP